MVLPVVLGVAFALNVTGATSATAFALSRPAQERFAREAHGGGLPLPAERWCGLYRARIGAGDVDDAGVILWLPGSGFLDRNGLYFRAAARPTTATVHFTTEPLGEPWEAVREDW